MDGKLTLSALAFEMLTEFITQEFTSVVKMSIGDHFSSMVEYPSLILFVVSLFLARK